MTDANINWLRLAGTMDAIDFDSTGKPTVNFERMQRTARELLPFVTYDSAAIAAMSEPERRHALDVFSRSMALFEELEQAL